MGDSRLGYLRGVQETQEEGVDAEDGGKHLVCESVAWTCLELCRGETATFGDRTQIGAREFPLVQTILAYGFLVHTFSNTRFESRWVIDRQSAPYNLKAKKNPMPNRESRGTKKSPLGQPTTGQSHPTSTSPYPIRYDDMCRFFRQYPRDCDSLQRETHFYGHSRGRPRVRIRRACIAQSFQRKKHASPRCSRASRVRRRQSRFTCVNGNRVIHCSHHQTRSREAPYQPYLPRRW